MPTAILQKNAPPKAPKPVSPKLKVVIRRLAPGLTQSEFESALGDEWKCGAGKVDWITYRPGHISTEYVARKYDHMCGTVLTRI